MSFIELSTKGRTEPLFNREAYLQYARSITGDFTHPDSRIKQLQKAFSESADKPQTVRPITKRVSHIKEPRSFRSPTRPSSDTSSRPHTPPTKLTEPQQEDRAEEAPLCCAKVNTPATMDIIASQKESHPLLEKYNSLPETPFITWCKGICNSVDSRTISTKTSNTSKGTLVHFDSKEATIPNSSDPLINGFSFPLTSQHFEQLAFYQIVDIMGYSTCAASVCCLLHEQQSRFYKECIFNLTTKNYAFPLSKFGSQKSTYQFKQHNVIPIALLDILFQNLDLSSIIIDLDDQENEAFLHIDNPHSFPAQKERSFFQQPLAQFIIEHCPHMFEQAIDKDTLNNLIQVDLKELLSPYFFDEDRNSFLFIQDQINVLKEILNSPIADSLTLKNFAILMDFIPQIKNPQQKKKILATTKLLQKFFKKHGKEFNHLVKSSQTLRPENQDITLTLHTSHTIWEKLRNILDYNIKYFNIKSIERTASGLPITSLQEYLLNKCPLPELINADLIDAKIVFGLYKKILRENSAMITDLNAFRSDSINYQPIKEAAIQTQQAYQKNDPSLIERLYAPNGIFFHTAQKLFAPEGMLYELRQYVYQNLKTIEKLIDLQITQYTSQHIIHHIFGKIFQKNENPYPSAEPESHEHIPSVRQVVEQERKVSMMYAATLFPIADTSYEYEFIKIDTIIVQEFFYYLLTHREEIFPLLL